MKRLILAAAIAAAALNLGAMTSATADPMGKPLLSGMKNENDADVQHIRDALTIFYGANKRWPTTFEELDLWADQYRIPHNIHVFDKTNYYVQTQGNATVAVFEFVMKGSPTKGAFAIANFIVK